MKKTSSIKKIAAGALSMALLLSLGACAKKDTPSPDGPTSVSVTKIPGGAAGTSGTTYKIGLCNYVDDASLNQIVDNIQSQLQAIGQERGVTFDVSYDNCNADAAVMATEDNGIPVVFSAVSDPVSAGLVASLEAPGANLTGTSDYLDTNAIMNLIFAADPDADKIGLLYDQGQDSSATPIAHAKEYLDAKGIEYVERTGTTNDEVMLAADALVADGVDAVFTPTDNTIMTAELAIYETFNEAGIPHYTGADSFALNGAFLGYGVDYANLGVETANMAASILIDGEDPGTIPVLTFDNGTATVNTETCAALGLDFDEIEKVFAPLCTKVQQITTAEEFGDLAG